MSEQYKPGDRVKVTIEGVVKNHEAAGGAPHRLRLQNAHGNASHLVFTNQDDITVEKLEPPVETFKPGDTVRDKEQSEYVYSIGKDGYFDHRMKRYYKDGVPFTSDEYERVNVG